MSATLLQWMADKDMNPITGSKIAENSGVYAVYHNLAIEMGLLNDVPKMPIAKLKPIMAKWKENTSVNPVNGMHIDVDSDVYLEFSRWYSNCYPRPISYTPTPMDPALEERLKVIADEIICNDIQGIDRYLLEKHPSMIKYKGTIFKFMKR